VATLKVQYLICKPKLEVTTKAWRSMKRFFPLNSTLVNTYIILLFTAEMLYQITP